MGNSLFAFYHRIFYGILILLRWILNVKIPFLLLIQAACFCLPHLFWEKMCNYSGKIHISWIFVNLLCFFLGINVNQVLNVSADPANIKKETKDQNVQAVSQHLRVCLNNSFCLRSYCYVSFIFRMPWICMSAIEVGPSFVDWIWSTPENILRACIS